MCGGTGVSYPAIATSKPGKLVSDPWRYVAVALAVCSLAVATYLAISATRVETPLSNEQIRQFLSDESDPGGITYAIRQLDSRRSRGENIAAWYPVVLKLANSHSEEVRSRVAHLMGEDPSYPAFRPALHEMLRSPSPLVRNAAALALAEFGDSAAHDQLLAMLQSMQVMAPVAGRVESTVSAGDEVSEATVLVRMRNAGATSEIHSPVSGRVRRMLVQEGDDLSAGINVAIVDPGPAQVLQALHALGQVGYVEDLPLLNAYMRAGGGIPDNVRNEVAQTEKAIRQRTAQ